MIRKGSCSITRGEYYELTQHIFEKGSCNEEEQYQPILEREEEEAESTNPQYEYEKPTTPHKYSEIISKNSSPSQFVNTTNNNSGNNGQGSPVSQNFCPVVQKSI